MQQLNPKAVWLFFINSLLGSIFAFVFLGVWLGFFLSSFIGVGAVLAVFVIFLIVFSYIWAKLTYKFYKYELREDGFRKEHGIIWKKYVTIPYDRIQNVDIYRGLIARLLGLSDLQIQTAGGITAGSYGAFSEGRLPGLTKEVAEQIRDEVIRRARQSRTQGL